MRMDISKKAGEKSSVFFGGKVFSGSLILNSRIFIRKESIVMKQNGNAVSLTQKLVQIDSTNPGNGESGMEKFLVEFADQFPIGQVSVQREEVTDGRNNVMLTLPGKTDQPELIFICHMDTVPTGEGWNADPFSGEIINDRIYGRGSCDMKSGFACALSAFKNASDYSMDHGMPERTLKLIGTVDEEGDMTGVEQAIRTGWISRDSLVLDTEPTNGEIQAAHKGRTWFQITVEGITAHASTPWKGADAIAAMAEVISFIRKEFSGLEHHPQLGASTVTFGQISGGTQPYVVSERCMVTVDMRLVPPYTSAYAQKIVERAALYAEKAVPKAKISYCITGDRPFIEKHEDSELLAGLRAACEKVAGRPAKESAFNGYTDTAVIAGKLDNRNCMSYGPGDLELAHKPNEYVPTEDILRCEKVLTELVFQMLF